jgi:MbtH protein
MSHPFDDKSANFLVLCNGEGQYSLWPVYIDVPPGWAVALPASDRASCDAFIEANWTDMRPRSLTDHEA